MSTPKRHQTVSDALDRKMETNTDQIRLGIIGCGAISQLGHGQGALLSRRAKLTKLVDLDIDRARSLGSNLGVSNIANNIDGIKQDIDAAIIAVPHKAHLAVGTELMAQGIHVLMEKPLGCTVEECRKLSDAASTNNVVLAVALVRRFVAVNQLIKKIIDLQLLGKPVSFEMLEARVFAWPSKSNFLLDPEEPGRGVLIGNGSHMFDLALWWFGDVSEVDCKLDSNNKAETDAEVRITMQSGVQGQIILSRTRNLGDETCIIFENGRIKVSPFGPRITIESNDGPLFDGLPSIDKFGTPTTDLGQLMAYQIDDFIAALVEKTPPETGAQIATKVVALVERCRAVATVSGETWWNHRVFDEETASKITRTYLASP